MFQKDAVEKAEQSLIEASEFSDEDPAYAKVIRAKIDLADAWLRLLPQLNA